MPGFHMYARTGVQQNSLSRENWELTGRDDKHVMNGKFDMNETNVAVWSKGVSQIPKGIGN